MRVTVTSDVDSIVFASDLRNGEYHDWMLAGGMLNGFFGSPKPKESTTPRQRSDGDFAPTSLTSSGRTLTLTASTSSCSAVEHGLKMSRLCDLMMRDLTIRVESEQGVVHMHGYIADDFEPYAYVSQDRLFFSLIIYCPDPHKYGEPVSYVQSGSWLTVTNTGRLPVYPKLSVAGPVSSWGLAGDAGSVSWSGDSVDSVSVDLRDMIPSSGVMGVTPPLTIPPGTSRLQCSGTTGSVMTLTLEPAWR